MDARQVLNKLSLEEKIELLSGKNFWYLNEIGSSHLKSIMVTDGPHGLRKQKDSGDHLGISNSYPATCFPTASALACTWDEDLLYKLGEYLGNECLSQNVSVLLGPGINIKRHPLCGRNFEYFSEDPILTGKLASKMIQGVQSKGVGTSLKHFALNNQETMRMVVDVIVDERSFRELYLRGFEIAIKEAKPWTVMSSYNKINGTYASENKKLLQDILKDEWAYDGLVVTDWGANNDRVQGIIAGQDLEMPGNGNIHKEAIKDALDKGIISEELLDRRVLKVIELIIKANETLEKDHSDYDMDKHHDFARKVASESMVLLKNDDDILPISKQDTIALIGGFAKQPRYQGSGSSLINPSKISTAYDAFKERLKDNLIYAPGYDLQTDTINQDLIDEAIKVSKEADTVIVMAGLTDDYESEGFDREHIDIPKNHLALIEAISNNHDQVIVALSNGSPVSMPWLDKVKGVIEQYLSGQASGAALADIVFGDVNPSGKLAESFPLSIEDLPANENFPGKPRQLKYQEGLYVGYRAHEKQDNVPLFPFGYGLSYTSFELKDFAISKNRNTINIKLNITNTGDLFGKEVIQVYVGKEESRLYRPIKELKAFTKVDLKAKETKEVSIDIDKELLKVYQNGFKLESGKYKIYIGTSSQDILYSDILDIQSKDDVVDDQLIQYKNFNKKSILSDKDFTHLLGHDIPTYPSSKPYSLNSTMSEIKNTFIGKRIYKMIAKQMAPMIDQEMNDTTRKMIDKSVGEMPFRSLVVFSGGQLSMKKAQGLLDLMNKKFFKGLFKLISG